MVVIPEPVATAVETDAIELDTTESTSSLTASLTTDVVKAGDSLAIFHSRNGFSAKDLHTISRHALANNSKTYFLAIA